MDALTELVRLVGEMERRVARLEAQDVPVIGGGGAGAPADAAYLTLALHAGLTAERRLVDGTDLTGVDAGAGSTYTLNHDDTLVTPGAYGSATQVGTFTVNQRGHLTAAANVAITGVPPAVHDMITAHSYAGGAALDVFGLSAPNTIARLTPSSNPGAVAAILCTDGTGSFTVVNVNATGIITAKPAASAGIALNPNAATGNFTLSLVPANLTAARTVTFANVAGTVALGTGAANTLTYWSGVNTLTNLANSGSVSYLRNDGAGALSWVTGTPIAGTPGTLTVSSVNAAADPHTHAITSSSNPGAAAAILASDANGYLQLVGLGINTAAVSTSGIRIDRTQTAGTTAFFGISNTTTINYPSAQKGSAETAGFRNQLVINGYGSAYNYTSGLYQALTINLTSGQTVAATHAYFLDASITAGSNVTVFNSALLQCNVAGAVNTYGGVKVYQATGAGTISIYKGVWCTTPSATITWGAQLYLETITATTAYSIYSAGGQSYHAGNFGIGSAITAPSVPLHITTNNATTNAVDELVRIQHDSTGTAAAGFGAALDWYLESSTTAGQVAARDAVLWTDATHASRTALRRGQTTGNAVNTGYFGHWNYSAVANTAITVIPNATGDVTEVLTCLYAVSAVTGGDAMGGVCVLEPGDSFNLYSDGTDTLTLAVAADGSVTVQRTAGADTFKVSLWMTWI